MRASILTLLIAGAVLVSAQAPAPSPSTSRPGEIARPTKPASGANSGKPADPNKGTGVIRGRILTANGRPARLASIQLTSSGSPRATAADADGRYEFQELPADSYRISAGKPGYLVFEYGEQRPFERGKVVALGAGETLEKLDITLPVSGSVSGRIADENGGPVELATVRLLQLQFGANRRQLTPLAGVGARATDDTGHYRIYGVPPGQYAVVATLLDQLAAPGGNPRQLPPASPGYAPTYYPGTPAPSEAQLVAVGLSQDMANVDFTLSQAPTARLSGVAHDSADQPLRGTIILSRSRQSGALVSDIVRKPLGGAGDFRFDNVPPGEYVLQAYGARTNQPVEPPFGYQVLSVNGKNITDLQINASAGSTVSGRVILEGAGEDVKPNGVLIAAMPTDFDRAPLAQDMILRARPDSDGRFQIGGLNGPRRLRIVAAPRSWSLKSIRVDDVDVTDESMPFGSRQQSLANVEVVLTKAAASITGTVADVRGQLTPEYTVVVFSTNEERWYQRSRFMAFARPKQNGTFVASDLPPGEYYVAAVDWMQGNENAGEWQDPAFLESMAPRAERVVLAEGQAASLALRLIVR